MFYEILDRGRLQFQTPVKFTSHSLLSRTLHRFPMIELMPNPPAAPQQVKYKLHQLKDYAMPMSLCSIWSETARFTTVPVHEHHC